MQASITDRADAPSASASPFMSRIMKVEPEWIDYNGHLNMAYYNVLFDRCVDEAFATVGLGPEYARLHRASFFTAEAHICYLRELDEGARVRASFRLLDHDAKRVHGFQELRHEDGWLSATCEIMILHVDTAEKRVCPWPVEIAERLSAMKEAHNGLPRPPQVGRIIGMKRRAED